MSGVVFHFGNFMCSKELSIKSETSYSETATKTEQTNQENTEALLVDKSTVWHINNVLVSLHGKENLQII